MSGIGGAARGGFALSGFPVYCVQQHGPKDKSGEGCI
jgi:hypothetical protein